MRPFRLVERRVGGRNELVLARRRAGTRRRRSWPRRGSASRPVLRAAGPRTSFRIRSASCRPPSRSVPGSSRANSSPPQRPARSISRTLSWRRWANALRTSSPVGWPQRSLIRLKSSMSASTSVSGSSKRWARASSFSSAAVESRRFARPVRLSTSACCSTVRCWRALLERDHRVTDEPAGALALVRAEVVAVEDERAEALPAGGQRELELRRAPARRRRR